MVGVEQAATQADGFSCKEELMILGGVIAAETAAIVAMAKVGWTHLKEQLKAEREHSASLEVTFNAARQKRGESPK